MLRPCPECSKEISSDVKKCPHCGKDFRNWFMRHKVITFIGAFIVLIILASAASSNKNNTNTNIATSTTVNTTSTNTVSSTEKPTPTPVTAAITKENYNKIHSGMTQDEVKAILGEPTSKSESELEGFGKTEMWHFQQGFSMKGADIYFTNGKVSSKNWTEL